VKRFLLAALLAMALHALLLGIDLPRRIQRPMPPPGIAVELAVRKEKGKPAAALKKAAPKATEKPATPTPPWPKPEKKNPRPAPSPKKQAVEKVTAEREKPVLAPPEKKSTIEKKAAPAPPSPPGGDELPTEDLPQFKTQTGANDAATVAAPSKKGASAETQKPADRRLAMPAYQRNRQPEYPPRARNRGWSGTVFLKVLVSAEGRVAELAVDRSSGHSILDQAALKAVADWLFEPATENGVAVSMWVEVPVTFRLQEQ